LRSGVAVLASSGARVLARRDAAGCRRDRRAGRPGRVDGPQPVQVRLPGAPPRRDDLHWRVGHDGGPRRVWGADVSAVRGLVASAGLRLAPDPASGL